METLLLTKVEKSILSKRRDQGVTNLFILEKQ
jgi:hypothetical protein